MSRYRSYSAPFPLSTHGTPSISVAHTLPEYHVPDILPTPITAAIITNRQNKANAHINLDLTLSSFSTDPPICSGPPITAIQTNTSPDLYIPRPSIFNGGTHISQSYITLNSTISEAKHWRRTQNRVAQRKFRERKETYLKNLEEKAKRLVEFEAKCEELERENAELKIKLQNLKTN
ncbi:hypothetical protein BKA69DRAFT_1039293 [Paraphysoderma sedebokerense]|nr:hypothetical protein BKA69DRAFT_1039293 [Paraphysoderma sedebokerense]